MSAEAQLEHVLKLKGRPTMDENVRRAVQENGDLNANNLSWWIWWGKGSKDVSLDGHFTAAQLRDIADHMDREQQRGS